MNRRELIKIISLATGSALVGGNLALSGCSRRQALENLTFSAEDVALLDEIAETIIPRTDTPGAKDAEVGDFMTLIVDNCYFEDDQRTFHEGMVSVNELSMDRFGDVFTALTAEQRTGMLTDLDEEARAYRRPENGTEHYFTMMKQLALLGFFTSETGQKDVLRHVPIPGRYDGCFPYEKGDRAWAI